MIISSLPFMIMLDDHSIKSRDLKIDCSDSLPNFNRKYDVKTYFNEQAISSSSTISDCYLMDIMTIIGVSVV